MPLLRHGLLYYMSSAQAMMIRKKMSDLLPLRLAFAVYSSVLPGTLSIHIGWPPGQEEE